MNPVYVINAISFETVLPKRPKVLIVSFKLILFDFLKFTVMFYTFYKNLIKITKFDWNGNCLEENILLSRAISNMEGHRRSVKTKTGGGGQSV